jgi:transglutaminase-like putative cysteine protease
MIIKEWGAAMFTQFETDQIDHNFNKIMAMTDMGEKITASLDICTSDEKYCLKFLYAVMPFSDMATHEFGLFLAFVRSALKTRDNMPWGKKIATNIFLNYVLFYRVNNENIEDYRELFYNQIYPRIQDQSMLDAALEVNYWCYEKATYKTTDDRTASPLTVIKSGYGRCGEESTLAVCALRSVGIPARECYVPRWSHCDDNHAWVEVWIDGELNYMGACEPEPVLNKSWFTYAASKAMLVESKVFSNMVDEKSEVFVCCNDHLTIVNNLKTYAAVKLLTVRIVTNDKKPVQGAIVSFEVLNYSELYSIATISTDLDGSAQLLTGLGDLFIHVCKDGRFIYRKVDVRITDDIEINFDSAVQHENGTFDFDMFPPSSKNSVDIPLDDSQKDRHKVKLERAEKVRSSYESTFYTNTSAKEYAANFPAYNTQIEEYLVRSRGNYHQIIKFLENQYDLDIKVLLLGTLTSKDYADLSEHVLNDHIEYAKDYRVDYNDDVFSKYVLSPRIGYEFLSIFREFISNYFSEDEKELFRSNPMSVAKYIEINIRDCGDFDYSKISADPKGLLQMKTGSSLSKKHLFVAICRTFGIASRINPVNGIVEYFGADQWVAVEEGITKAGLKTCRLVLRDDTGNSFIYMQNYTISKLAGGAYSTLFFQNDNLHWERNELSIPLECGYYRVLTSDRQIDGSILARAYHVQLNRNSTITLDVAFRESQLHSRLKNMQIRNIELETVWGITVDLKMVLSTCTINILAVLDVNKEPTEHLLNEIVQLKDRLIKNNIQIVYLVDPSANLKNQTLLQALQAVPLTKLLLCNSREFPTMLFNDLEAGDHRLPLAAIVDNSMNARFAFSNYNVGTVELLLRIAENM